jgi:hypothetical protein
MRALLTLMLLAVLAGPARAAEPPITLQWDQLVPAGVEELDNTPPAFRRPEDDTAERRSAILKSVTTAYNGKRVRIPGFIVPLAMDGTKVNEFLLVPWFGACIHVPPPPPNQIVYVSSKQEVSIDDIYDPVWITGVMQTTVLSTDLADTGYTLQGETIEPYVQKSGRN